MPHYDYQCTGCGNIFEVFHNMSENPLISCPSCNGNTKKLISGGAGIIFKGSGFYKTDYAASKGAAVCENKSDSNPKCSCCPAGAHQS